ncbi:ABC transporter, ATP binding protein [Aeropyrum pernix]|uniref:ABC transporter, ATP binding protein n=1 Tax=Aeropyrum pernix TaxID=56636 RepID=A0A401H8Q5_AERPX|nr:ABC transporter ATP-binding protein [Aeropyrum pernix]GBF08722.1 ABC transporter, ATP binding protein [Aeropyrum pernix]
MEVVIEVEGLVKRYGSVEALRGVSFSVLSGEVFGYLGPNGAGKTTTIRVMMGFSRPTSGSARVFGVELYKPGASGVRRRVGYVPGEFEFYGGVSGWRMLDYWCRLVGGCSRGVVRELLEAFPLPLERAVDTYSRGMKQMLALVMAFSHEPDLVVMDEPTTGLDPLARGRVLDFVRSKAREGVTVFFSSHVLSEVQRVADRVGLLRGGVLVALEDVSSLLRKSGKVVKARVSKTLSPERLVVDGVRVVRSNGEVELVVSSGKALESVLRMLLDAGLEDLEVRDATLEEVFMHFYERTSGPGGKG